jgi:predicted branched-subunit amino acid permease
MNSPRMDAARDVLAVTPALLSFGVTLGVVVASTTTGDLAGWLGAPLVYSGSAQLAATTLFNHGAGLLTIVASAVAVNARLLLYSGRSGADFRAYWLGVGGGVAAVWSAAVGLGLSLGPHLPTLPHLPLASSALFLGMLTPRLREPTGRAAAIVAAAVAPVATQVVPTLGVLAGAAAGIGAGLAMRKRQPAT